MRSLPPLILVLVLLLLSSCVTAAGPKKLPEMDGIPIGQVALDIVGEDLDGVGLPN